MIAFSHLDPTPTTRLANKALVLAELDRSDESIETASRGLSSAPQRDDRSMLFAIRARISYPMSRFAHGEQIGGPEGELLQVVKL